MTEPNSPRWHGLDAVRALALLLGVFFHAMISFLDAQIMPFRDAHSSQALALLYVFLHLFRMIAFFVVAGFFSRHLLIRRGQQHFIQDRLKRIALPMLAFYPLTLVVFGVGLTLFLHGRPVPAEFASQKNVIPSFHLWFLLYLLLFYAVALTFRRALPHRWKDRLDALLAEAVQRGGYLLPVIPTALALALKPDWKYWLGFVNPPTFAPELSTFVTYSLAFGLGWFLHRQPARLQVFQRHWPVNLTTGLLSMGALLALIGLHPTIASETPVQGWIALAHALAAWSLAFAFIGACLHFLNEYRAHWRYLADASYWVYLIHLPVVFAWQLAVASLDLPALLKFTFVLLLTFTVSLGSYQLWVRHTWLGGWLNGTRHPRPLHEAGPVPPALPDLPPEIEVAGTD